MAPLIGAALLGGGFNIAGNMFNANQQKKVNDQNIWMARENREWETWMSNTAHQREVKDLQEAGLNPNLSATGGAGASTPGGSVPTLQAPQIQLPSINEVTSLLSAHQEQQKIDLQKQLIPEQVKKVKADTGLTGVKTIKEGKGMIRAEVETELSKVLKEQLKLIKDYWLNPQMKRNLQPPQPVSSGGELQLP